MGGLIKVGVQCVTKGIKWIIRIIKKPYGQGVVTGAVASEVIDIASKNVKDSVNKGKDIIDSIIVLGLVLSVAYLIVKK